MHLRADGPAEGGRNRRPRSTVSHSATGAPDRASAPQNQIGSACMPAPHSTNTALTSSEDSLRRHASHAARYVCVGVWVCMYPWRSIQYRLHTHTHSACGRVCVHTCTHGTHEAPKGASTKEGPCEMRIHPYRSPASAPPSPCLPHELGPRHCVVAWRATLSALSPASPPWPKCGRHELQPRPRAAPLK